MNKQLGLLMVADDAGPFVLSGKFAPVPVQKQTRIKKDI
jgi:hypothetical protein